MKKILIIAFLFVVCFSVKAQPYGIFGASLSNQPVIYIPFTNGAAAMYWMTNGSTNTAAGQITDNSGNAATIAVQGSSAAVWGTTPPYLLMNSTTPTYGQLSLFGGGGFSNASVAGHSNFSGSVDIYIPSTIVNSNIDWFEMSGPGGSQAPPRAATYIDASGKFNVTVQASSDFGTHYLTTSSTALTTGHDHTISWASDMELQYTTIYIDNETTPDASNYFGGGAGLFAQTPPYIITWGYCNSSTPGKADLQMGPHIIFTNLDVNGAIHQSNYNYFRSIGYTR